MKQTYIEQLIASDTRFEERRMLFSALRSRRGHLFPRRALAALLWLFGAR